MSGQDPAPLPPEAVAALQQGRTIDAIRIVRQAHGIGLRESKERVEAHLHRDPALAQAVADAKRDAGGAVWAWVFVVIAAALLLRMWLGWP